MGFAIGSSKDQELAIGGVKVGGFAIGNVKVWAPGPTGPHLYMAGRSNDRLYTLDVTNGAATQVSSSDLFRADVDHSFVFENVLYMYGSVTSVMSGLSIRTVKLYSVNTDTGIATLVDGISDNLGFPRGSSSVDVEIHGIEVVDGVIYAFLRGTRPEGLYTVDLSTGIATLKLSTFLREPLAFHNGVTYTIDRFQSGNSGRRGLYTFNLSTGARTRVGSHPDGIGRGLVFADMVSFNGSLYGIDSQYLYTLDTTTGIAQRIFGSARGFGVNEYQAETLAVI